MKNIFKNLISFPSDIAHIEQDCLHNFFKLKENGLLIITRALYCKCITDEEHKDLEEKINKLRSELQGLFHSLKQKGSTFSFYRLISLFNLRGIENEEIKQIKKKLINSIKIFEDDIKETIKSVQDREQAMPLSERINNINSSFIISFEKAKKEGLISEEIYIHIKRQAQNYKEAFEESIKNKSLRDNIKADLVYELYDDYFSNIYDIYKNIISKKLIKTWRY